MFMDPAQGRWVCPRCFESNEADADRCVKCDLERGADPAAAAATAPGAAAADARRPKAPSPPRRHPAARGPPPPAPESNRPGWLQLVLRFWWVGLLVIGGGIAAFNYLGGSRPVTDMSVGDCFDVAGCRMRRVHRRRHEAGVHGAAPVRDVLRRRPARWALSRRDDADGRFGRGQLRPGLRRLRGHRLPDLGARWRCRSRRPRTAGTTATTACSAPCTIRTTRSSRSR